MGSIEDLVANQADPRYTCSNCGHAWGNQRSADYCCEDEDLPTRPHRYELSD